MRFFARVSTYSLLPYLVCLGLSHGPLGCKGGTKPASDKTDVAAQPVAGLTADQAARVLATVGDRTITLGDFARTIDEMDPFDRLRYQSKERRRELLNELVEVELLAQEAKRRGLDKSPETEIAVRQMLRDALLSKARKDLPAPSEISADEVRAYYEKNEAQYEEPERRRVSAIVLADKARAEEVLKQASTAKTATEWGELFFKHSVTAPKSKGPTTPVELAGDLGIVGPPDDAKGSVASVPDEVRREVFALPKEIGKVVDHVVAAEGKYFIVRLAGTTPGHKRSLAEADRSIRVALLQQKMTEQEDALVASLREKHPVVVDDQALAKVNVPWASPSGSVAAPSAPSSNSK